jgi:hypothetical protein
MAWQSKENLARLAATAPRPNASATKLWPSACSPERHKQVAGSTSRLSITTRLIGCTAAPSGRRTSRMTSASQHRHITVRAAYSVFIARLQCRAPGVNLPRARAIWPPPSRRTSRGQPHENWRCRLATERRTGWRSSDQDNQTRVGYRSPPYDRRNRPGVIIAAGNRNLRRAGLAAMRWPGPGVRSLRKLSASLSARGPSARNGAANRRRLGRREGCRQSSAPPRAGAS